MKIIKIGDYVKIKEVVGVQFDNKNLKYQEGKLVGKVVRVFKGCIYKVEIAPANYLFCGENDIILIDNKDFQKEISSRKKFKNRKGIEIYENSRNRFKKR